MRNAITAAITVLGMLAVSPRAGAASDASVHPPAGDIAHQSIDSERASVRVRLYDSAVVPAADQTVALRAATGVLAAAGIDITWLLCGLAESASTPEACAIPLTRDELEVRLVRLPGRPSARGELSMGYSLVDTGMSGGALATVYVDRVTWLVSQAGRRPAIDAATLLGYAIAHELGHLLLGTNAHDAAGLMRAVWSRVQLQHSNPRDWVFSAAERLAMGRALRERRLLIASN